VEKVLLAEKMAGASFTRVGTEYNRAHLAGLPGGAAARILVMPFGVDTGRFVPAPPRPETAAPRREPVRNGAPGLRLVSVGRLVWEKAHHLLLDACARLMARGVDLRLTIVGDGPERAALLAQRDRLGLGDRVAWAGARPEAEVIAALQAADLFVLSSVSEGFGVVLLEAMACGLPVVAPALHGIPEFVTDGVEGVLFRPGSADDLARAIETAASDPGRRAAMGEAGRRKVVESFPLGDRVAAFDAVIRQALESAS
jgi:glycosyltransferase involved in cell wall biosynthesis